MVGSECMISASIIRKSLTMFQYQYNRLQPPMLSLTQYQGTPPFMYAPTIRTAEYPPPLSANRASLPSSCRVYQSRHPYLGSLQALITLARGKPRPLSTTTVLQYLLGVI